MSTLKIQDYLRFSDTVVPQENGLLALQNPPYSLNVKRHPKFPNLVQFTYDQIESVRDNPIVREARGLILDQSNNWNIVAYPFNRFFNYGEGPADQIDWSTARVQEKVDGTLFIFYHYDGHWRVATKGTPDAGGQVMDHRNIREEPYTFRDLFWDSCEHWLKGLNKSGEFDPDYTYMFELTSPLNRVVCNYSEVGPIGECVDGNGKTVFITDLCDQTGYAHDGSRITLIGVRNNKTLQEDPVFLYRHDFHYTVKEFNILTLSDVIKAANVLNPLKQEGFVVVDANFNRIKIKSPAYVAIHHLREGSPQRRIMELIQHNEDSEVMAYKLLDEFPDEKAMYLEFCQKIEWLCLQTETAYDSIKDITIQKDFAIEALKTPYHAAMFAIRKGRVRSAREFYLNLATDKLLDLITTVTL